MRVYRGAVVWLRRAPVERDRVGRLLLGILYFIYLNVSSFIVELFIGKLNCILIHNRSKTTMNCSSLIVELSIGKLNCLLIHYRSTTPIHFLPARSCKSRTWSTLLAPVIKRKVNCGVFTKFLFDSLCGLRNISSSFFLLLNYFQT